MLAFVLMLTPLAYAVSFGPYVWLSKSGNLTGQTKLIAQDCFRPLVLASAKWKTSESALLWYYNKWADLAAQERKQPINVETQHVSIRTVPDFSKPISEEITMLEGTKL